MKPLMHTYPQGAEITYRNGVTKIKTEQYGLITKARWLAQMTDKVLGGGQELQPGWRVVHLDMSTHGQEGHDDPRNLAVIKCRRFKFKFLPKPILKLPNPKRLGRMVLQAA